ncbi:MAG: DUF4147 domain-containing protein, partial [Anaerolineales bacterium]
MVEKERPTTGAPQWEDRLGHLQALVAASLAAVDPEACVRRHLCLETDSLIVDGTPYALDPASRVLVVGAGKAGVAMARGASRVLGAR